MEGEPLRIVISYRRDDSSGHAGHLYADLARHFGDDRVFIDIDNIEPGLDYTEVITGAIRAADVLIAVIGRSWLTATDRTGRRRIDKDDDLVRLEIESAIAARLRVMPVLVQEAEMPTVDDLPASLATFARRHAHEVSDKRWREDVAELIALLEAMARAKAGSRPGGESNRPQGGPDGPAAGAQPGPAEAGRSPAPKAAATVPGRPPWTNLAVAGGVAAVLVLGLVLAGVAALGGGGEAPPTSEPARRPALTRTVPVRSEVAWNDTEIDVAAGQAIEIVASGRIQTLAGSADRDSGPDGKEGEEFGNNVIPGVRHGALLGRIGQGEPFPVGSFLAGPSPGAGRLYLGVNDRGVENNAGEYTATVTAYAVTAS